MGFDWIFVNPIQRTGASGSLYSIADYFDIDPRLVDSQSDAGPLEQVRAVIDQAHRLGLRVMIDLVINHCAIDSKLVTQHPGWFKREAGRVQSPYCIEDGKKQIWKDLAQFDHVAGSDSEGLYRYLVSVVEHLISLGFDGFRCDAAYQVPQHFWTRLLRQVRTRRPDVVFVAETLGCTADQTRDTAEAGFDFVFNSSKWWDFRSSWLLEQYELTRETVPSIGFPESHDTQRLYVESCHNDAALRQRTLFTFLFATGAMIPIGFEFGFERRLHVVTTSSSDWEEPKLDLTDFIKRLNALKTQYPVFHEECPTQFLTLDNPNVLGMWKGSTTTRREALVLLNIDVQARQTLWVPTLRRMVQSAAPLTCVSPDNPLDYVAEPFHYELRPGEAIVLVTSR